MSCVILKVSICEKVIYCWYALLNVFRCQVENGLALYDTCIVDEHGRVTEL